MRPIRNPDEVVFRWIELREKLSAPKARDFVAERGLLFDTTCAQCDRDSSHRIEERSPKTGASRYVCESCNAPWRISIGFQLANEFDRTRRVNAADAAYSELGTYATLLAKLSDTEVRIYLILYLVEGAGSYTAVADAANERWPKMRPQHRGYGPRPRQWSEWLVRSVVLSGRRKIIDALYANDLRSVG